MADKQPEQTPETPERDAEVGAAGGFMYQKVRAATTPHGGMVLYWDDGPEVFHPLPELGAPLAASGREMEGTLGSWLSSVSRAGRPCCDTLLADGGAAKGLMASPVRPRAFPAALKGETRATKKQRTL